MVGEGGRGGVTPEYYKFHIFTYLCRVLSTNSVNFSDKFYVRAENVEGQFCLTPNTIKNRLIKKNSKH